MKLPSVPGVVSGVRERWRARGSSAARPADIPADRRDTEPGLPMPLALQGVVELLVVAVVGLVLGAVLLGAVWAAGGFATLGAGGSLHLAGQVWLLAHGAPVTIGSVSGLRLDGGGTVTLVPLGLSLIPFGLAVIAGRRIARACWRGQFLLPFFTGTVGYGLLAALVALLSRTEQVSVDPARAALNALVPVGLGALVGGWSVSRSLAAVIGADAASWLQRTSQYSRWAGSYVWAVIRAGFLAAVAAIGAGALLLAITLAWHWDRVVTVYQDLGTGAAGDTALTTLQLGFLPNMILWALAWATGAGFSLGAGTVTSPFASTLGPLPQFPALAALPTGDPWSVAPGVLALPVLAGLLAGWWFCREGENHLDDWMAIRLPLRWFTFLLSTLLTVVLIAAVGSGLVALVTWLSHGSLGIGRLTDIGPHAWQVFLWLGAELAVGAALGYVLGPWLEREGYRSRGWDAQNEQAPDDGGDGRRADAAPRGASTTAPGAAAERREVAPGSTGAGAAPAVEQRTAGGSSRVLAAPGPRQAAGSQRSAAPARAVVGAGTARAGGSTAWSRGARGPESAARGVKKDEAHTALSHREEAKRRRAQKRSAKRKAARFTVLDREDEG